MPAAMPEPLPHRPHRPHRPAAAYGRLAALSLVWGSVFLWIKISGRGFSPVQMVLVRLALGAAVLLALARLRGLRLPRGAVAWGHLTVGAVLCNAVPWTLYAEGERHGSSSVAGVVNGSAPIWTLTAGLLLGGERRVGPARVGGVLLGLGGTALIASPWSGGHSDRSGLLFFVLGSVSFGSGFAYVGRYLSRLGIPPLTLAGGQLAVAAVLMLLPLPFLGLQPVHWRADATLSLLVLGVVCTGLASLLNTEIIVRDGPTTASTVMYLMTAVAVVLGAGALGEPLGWTVWVGAAAVLAATALLRRTPRTSSPAAGPERLQGREELGEQPPMGVEG